MSVDAPAAEAAIAAFLRALGHDPAREEALEATPARVTEAFTNELLSGERRDVGELLLEGSEPAPDGEQGVVVVDNIDVATVCPHHLLPGVGKATVAYLPGSRIVGIGAIARLVDACARRLTLQEAIGKNVVDALIEHAGALGAYCGLSMLHTCLATRGAKQSDARVRTVATGGAFDDAEGAARLALALKTEEKEDT